ncbi:hypothetical protein CAPTEDRAFT_185292 [Capitella teleta]|uniref:Uncharacterized protein n=1 Tax=Capitella teleta TaxID=283909 RepID=R7T5F0_CAPTE|nr:hypothetical protein CAPTEDRAFT_185292 [Capitella teleta]|eukprot:ELT88348.1 hypothetical protein CAPTEDRAFT_185292 [Capitella teleta]
MEACRSLENWFVRRVDIRVTFAALCVAILLLVLSLSPSLLSSRPPSIKTAYSSFKGDYNLWDESEQHLDVHLEGPERGHEVMGELLDDSVVSHIHHSHIKSNRTSIAIGLAITTRDQEFLSIDNLQYRTPFLKTLLPTFCKSASSGFDYHFYVAFDLNDPHLRQDEFLMAIHQCFLSMVKELCVSSSSFFLHFVQCNHNRSPSWAQNDAMMEAYMDGVDFYYRVNDDTQLLSPQWTEAFIEALAGFDPPNIGVVGPSHKGGNERILTYDFVHHSHIDIFGLYYPRLFTDWWADNWMTKVYGSARTMKVPSVRVMHTLEAGTRYNVQYDVSSLLEAQIADDRATLSRFLEAPSANSTSNQRKVISMSLWGDSPKYTFGALRNAQLVPVFFPDWRLRVYVEKPLSSGKTQHHPVPQRILDKLDQLGAEMFYVNALQSQVPPMMWRFLVADDLTLDRFIVRDADARLSDRDALIVKDWEASDAVFHCVRDHPSHATYALLGGMWGAQPKKLKDIVHIPWQNLMMGYRQDYVMDMSFLANAVWPRVQAFAFCHDSVSCTQWPSAHPFPVPRVRAEHVGQVFDAFGNARDEDVKIILQNPVVKECVTNKFNVSSNPQRAAFMGLMFKDDPTFPPSIRAPIRKEKPSQVIWSVDIDNGPVRDVKSLLVPLGIKFLDQSLSSQCLFTHNCASNLRVITKKNIMSYDPEAVKLFASEYEDDPQMNQVTHFLCTSPVALCEYYMPFNKPLIIYITHRYEMGRYLNADWQRWNEHLAEIAQNPENAIAASNQYDAAYLNYYTGIQAKVIPSLCKYVLAHYKPQRHSVLLASLLNPAFEEYFFSTIRKTDFVSNSSVSLPPIHAMRDLYPDYTFENISLHNAIIHVPHQVYTTSLCEHYAMNIPLLVPTVELLIDWHLKFNLLSPLSFEGIRSLSESPAVIPRGNLQMPDPNKINDAGSLNAWLPLADYYVMDHIVYFSSIPDLFNKLVSLDFDEISRKMSSANHVKKVRVMEEWQRVFRGV